MLSLQHLPPSAQEIAEVIGLEALQALVDWRGGVYVNVPANHVDENHVLVRVLGLVAANQLIDQYRGEPLPVPKCQASITAARHAEVLQLRETMSEASVALQTGYSDRHVRRICEDQANDDQPDLFG